MNDHLSVDSYSQPSFILLKISNPLIQKLPFRNYMDSNIDVLMREGFSEFFVNILFHLAVICTVELISYGYAPTT